MDDEEKFGPVLHRLTFAQAIDQDLLSDYQVVVVGVSDTEAHDLAERGRLRHRATARRSPTPGRSPARSACFGRWRSTTCTASSASTRGSIDASRFAASLPETNAVAARPPPPERGALDASTSPGR